MTAYTLFLLFATGMKFMLLGPIIYAPGAVAPGTVMYYMARREPGKTAFTPAEWALFAAPVVGAVVGIHGLVTGYVTI